MRISPAESLTPNGRRKRYCPYPKVLSAITTRFERDLRGLGLPATIESCRLMEMVAVGVRGSDTSYGDACRVAFADKPSKELLLCDDDFGESFAMVTSSFVETPAWREGFVRRECF